MQQSCTCGSVRGVSGQLTSLPRPEILGWIETLPDVFPELFAGTNRAMLDAPNDLRAVPGTYLTTTVKHSKYVDITLDN